MNDVQESALAVVIAVVFATFASFLTYAATCAEQHACINAGTCYATSSHALSCAFKTSLTPAGWRMLNQSDQEAAMQKANRGICAPGLRQSVDPDDGSVTCVRQRSYPDALNAEIGDASATSDHQKYCGSWIDASSIMIGNEKWAFFDEAAVEADVEEVLLAKGTGRLAASDVSKFRTQCRTMITSDTTAVASQHAFEYLDGLIGSVANVNNALAALGMLSSHYCDAPASVGLTFGDSGFIVNVTDGVMLDGQVLRQALYGVGVDHSTRDHAAEYADAMEAIATGDVQLIQDAQAYYVTVGSYVGTWLEGYVSSSFNVLYYAYNNPLARFAQAFNRYDGGAARARAYLRGVAAYCTFAARSVVTGEFGRISPSLEETAHSIRRSKPPAAGLGRLKSTSVDADRFVPANEHTLLNASKTTWSSLTASKPLKNSLMGIAAASRSSARSACLSAARVAFPDAFDKFAFDLLVTDRLYDRLESATADIKNAMEATLGGDLIGPLFSSDSNQAFTISLFQQTRLRIAGAPRGTWAGVSHDFVRPELASTDGALLILLKQARAVFLDRMYKALAGLSVCEHPPVYDGLTRNAYLLLSSSYSCAMLLPGILVPPFADERYDDASLFSRIGYVVAHEMAHVTAFDSLWNAEYVASLLADYQPSTYVEALADVAGVAAIMSLGIVNNETLCGHVSQLWCGRVGWLDHGFLSNPSHPVTNERGDAVCSFLRRHF